MMSCYIRFPAVFIAGIVLEPVTQMVARVCISTVPRPLRAEFSEITSRLSLSFCRRVC